LVAAQSLASIRTPRLADNEATLANQIADFVKHGAEAENAEAVREMAAAERVSLAIGVCAIALLLGTWMFSFFTIARPMRTLTVAMEELAGGNFAVVLPGLGRTTCNVAPARPDLRPRKYFRPRNRCPVTATASSSRSASSSTRCARPDDGAKQHQHPVSERRGFHLPDCRTKFKEWTKSGEMRRPVTASCMGVSIPMQISSEDLVGQRRVQTGSAADITGYAERQARTVLYELTAKGCLA
jgi:hypothetical protein